MTSLFNSRSIKSSFWLLAAKVTPTVPATFTAVFTAIVAATAICVVAQSQSALASTSYGAASVRYPNLNFFINDGGASGAAAGTNLFYSPKIPTIAGAEISAHGVTLGYSKAVSVSTADNQLDFTDYSFRYYLTSIGIDALYSEFLGFQLASAANLNLTSLAADQIFRSDLAVKDTNVNLYYFPLRLNWDFSKEFDASESDHTNGLAAGLVASYNNFGIDTKFGAIPTAFQTTFGADGSLIRGGFQSYFLSAAVAGTVSLRPIFLSLMATIGQGPQYLTFTNGTGDVTSNGTATRQSYLALLGISGATFFTALQVSFESPTYTLKTISLLTAHTDAGLKIGLKF